MSFSSIGIVVIQYREFMEAASRFSPSFRVFQAKDFYSQDLLHRPSGFPLPAIISDMLFGSDPGKNLFGSLLL